MTVACGADVVELFEIPASVLWSWVRVWLTSIGASRERREMMYREKVVYIIFVWSSRCPKIKASLKHVALAWLPNRIIPHLSSILPPFKAVCRFNRVCFLLAHSRVDLIHSVERQAQKLVLVVPPHILLLELLGFLRWWWRVGDLGDKVCSRGFRDTIDEDTKKRHFEEEEEGDCEAIKHTGAVVEPQLLLLRSVANTSEVRVELNGSIVSVISLGVDID